MSNAMILALNSMMERREKPSETGQGIADNLDMMAGVFGSMAAFARMVAVAAFEVSAASPSGSQAAGEPEEETE
jgi:hypothetical protein